MAASVPTLAPTLPVVPVPSDPSGPPVGGGGDAPPVRDLTVDLLRAFAIVAVAVGHWLVVVPSYADGRFDGVNALATVPAMRPLTWLFQVMPLFFVVGGVANAASWDRARRRGETYGTWLRTRLDRLIVPAVAMVGAWAALAAGLRAGGVDAALVEPMAWLVTVPIWFLAVYVLVVALAPAGWWAHRRWGVLPVVGVLTAAAVGVDAVRLGGGPTGEAIASVSFVLVFGVAQHLGFAWYDGTLLARRRVVGWSSLLGGLGALVALTTVGPYPVSLVGYPGVEVANNAPPTVTLIALGLAQTGAALLLRPVLARALERRPVQAFALVLNRNAMTVLLWHFTVLVVVAVVALPLGWVPVHPDGSAAWWLTRVVWVVVLATVAVPVVAVAGRVERRRAVRGRPRTGSGHRATPTVASRPESLGPDRFRARNHAHRGPVPGSGRVDGIGATWSAVVAVPVLAWSFGRITLEGLSVADGPWGVPTVSLALLALGTVLVRSRASDAPAERR